MWMMKRTLCALLTILTAACSPTTTPVQVGFWIPHRALTGYVAGTVTVTSYGGVNPDPEPRMHVVTGRVAGEHRGINPCLMMKSHAR